MPQDYREDGQVDLFLPQLTALPLRDQRETMERPFFSLSKRKRLKLHRMPYDHTGAAKAILAAGLHPNLAERLHQRVRTEFWGYAADESLSVEEIIGEGYRGIRPAPGYPACPEHSEKATLFRLLDAGSHAGMSLTESFAMLPTAAVSGYYFSHPQSQYFVVGRVSKEQVADYARRKGVEIAQVERWLASNLDYDPE